MTQSRSGPSTSKRQSTSSSAGTAADAGLPRTWRINYTIGDTTPSFAVSSVNVNYIL
jgi:hypothetical protein